MSSPAVTNLGTSNDTPIMVPMLSPDGRAGDIPQERVAEAAKAGFIPATEMQSPDGRIGVIPSGRVDDALKAGFKLTPSYRPGMPDTPAQEALSADEPQSAGDFGSMGTIGDFNVMNFPQDQRDQAASTMAKVAAGSAVAGLAAPYAIDAAVSPAGRAALRAAAKKYGPSVIKGGVWGASGVAAHVAMRKLLGELLK